VRRESLLVTGHTDLTFTSECDIPVSGKIFGRRR
jgi:hypothetical protein